MITVRRDKMTLTEEQLGTFMFQLVLDINHIHNKLDRLEDAGIYRHRMKQVGTPFKNELDRYISFMFPKGVKEMVEVFDRDNLLDNRVKNLSAEKRQSLSHILDEWEQIES